MTFLTTDQLGALGKKCFHCDKKSTWIAHSEWPAYCDDHFPYTLEKNAKVPPPGDNENG